jgi:hypothetical protein
VNHDREEEWRNRNLIAEYLTVLCSLACGARSGVGKVRGLIFPCKAKAWEPERYAHVVGRTDTILCDHINRKYTQQRYLPPSKVSGTQVQRVIIADGSIITDAHIDRAVIGIRSVAAR